MVWTKVKKKKENLKVCFLKHAAISMPLYSSVWTQEFVLYFPTLGNEKASAGMWMDRDVSVKE